MSDTVPPFRPGRRAGLAAALVCAAALGLAGCSPAPPGGGIHDPYEPVNRQVHALNKGLDRALVRPVGQVVGQDPASFQWVINFSDNASLPGMVLNKALQGDLEGMIVNGMRFVVNTTLGLGGLADFATPMGLEERKTDFGQTLAVWGFPEGAYVELPVLGPSTERDAVGEIVDIFLDPLERYGTRAQRELSTVAWAGEQVVERGTFGATVDDLLYNSADSYAQARLAYLQNRRFELGEEPPRAAVPDAEAEAYVDDLLEDLYR